MEIVITDEEGVTLLELSGRMDATTAAEFDNAVRALPRQGARLLIDMAGLEYISSAGLRSILGLVKSVRTSAGKLAFCALQPMVAEVFRISGFTAMLAVCDSRDEARVALRG
ncbi:MAG: STAS domain-containing protein [Desulfovibrio sp.]|nr:STAS domain-containing protein [Desulfovibrio sp.]